MRGATACGSSCGLMAGVLGLRRASIPFIALALFMTLVAWESNATADPARRATQKIKHVVVIMQENRSFDSYFGTYPGVDGLARNADGSFKACVPSMNGPCQRPYHDPSLVNQGGPHAPNDAIGDIDGGRMDGFVRQAEAATSCPVSGDVDPNCSPKHPDVMGFHDQREIPLYWSYADNYVLQDHMFEPNLGWSLPSHLFLVSGWSARCASPTDPMSCENDLQLYDHLWTKKNDYAWTDLTYLLHKARVPWAYYVEKGTQPDCEDGQMACPPVKQSPSTPGIWNPLPEFATVQQDGQTGNIQSLDQFRAAATSGRLPAIAWIAPSLNDSEHPDASIATGQQYVKNLVTSLMCSPAWSSTAVFLAWDDWGGFYDHVRPPKVDANGYGLRVPGLLISPYAKRGYVDHQVLSFDAYAKFVEDIFLGGQRIDPRTDGRPDRRPTVRESLSQLGDLRKAFDFSQPPRPPAGVRCGK